MFISHVKRLASIICICMLAGSFSGNRASALEPLVFTVDTTIDQRDFATNSVCSIGAPVDGDCTLRAAISEAIGNVPDKDIIINIPAGNYLLTIPPDATNDIHTGDLNLPSSDSPFTISMIGTDKQPAVIDANELDRVFRIGAGVHLSIENLVIRGGIIKSTDPNLYGAGIANMGNLALEKVVLEGNKGECTTASCSETFAGAGIAHLGHGYLIIIDTIIQNNLAYNGSAIYNDSAQINIRNSTIANNHAVAGISILNHGTIDILNSTISGNSTNEGFNSGIYNTGTLKIYSATISNAGPVSSILNMGSGSVSIQDSILAAYPASFSSNCDPLSTGAWISTGYNIFSDDTCPWNGLAGDLKNTDAGLGPLGFWGGQTPTMPLGSKSPAINHRPTPCMTPLLPINNDQRYFPRNDTLCDTGAFEGVLDLNKAFLPLINR